MKTYDAIIVGGGLIGSAIALELARNDARVALFDLQEPGRQASWASAGILSPAPENPGMISMVPIGKAGLADRNHRNHSRIFGCGRKNSGAGPRCLAARFLEIEKRDARVIASQFKGNGAADQSSSNDNCVVGFHFCILAHLSSADSSGSPPARVAGS